MLGKSSFKHMPVYVLLSDGSSQNHLLGNMSQILRKKELPLHREKWHDCTCFLAPEITVLTQLAHSDRERESSFLVVQKVHVFTREVFLKEHVVSIHLPLQFPGETSLIHFGNVAATCFNRLVSYYCVRKK